MIALFQYMRNLHIRLQDEILYRVSEHEVPAELIQLFDKYNPRIVSKELDLELDTALLAYLRDHPEHKKTINNIARIF